MDSGIVIKNLDSDCSASYQAANAFAKWDKLFDDEFTPTMTFI
jgi:hypothetical protein